MPALTDEHMEQLIVQYLKTPQGRVKLVHAMVDAAERETKALRGEGEPSEAVIEKLRDISHRLIAVSPMAGLPPPLRDIIPELESAWHDYQNLPRPGRYRTLSEDDDAPSPSSTRTW